MWLTVVPCYVGAWWRHPLYLAHPGARTGRASRRWRSSRCHPYQLEQAGLASTLAIHSTLLRSTRRGRTVEKRHTAQLQGNAWEWDEGRDQSRLSCWAERAEDSRAGHWTAQRTAAECAAAVPTSDHLPWPRPRLRCLAAADDARPPVRCAAAQQHLSCSFHFELSGVPPSLFVLVQATRPRCAGEGHSQRTTLLSLSLLLHLCAVYCTRFV